MLGVIFVCYFIILFYNFEAHWIGTKIGGNGHSRVSKEDFRTELDFVYERPKVIAMQPTQTTRT